MEHTGYAVGFSTIVRMVPERGFAVIAFVNNAAAPDDIADAATSAFLGVPEMQPQAPSTIADWPAFVGDYEDQTGLLGKVHVYIEGDALRARRDGGERQIPIVGGGTFIRDANHRGEYFVTRAGVARRVIQ